MSYYRYQTHGNNLDCVARLEICQADYLLNHIRTNCLKL